MIDYLQRSGDPVQWKKKMDARYPEAKMFETRAGISEEVMKDPAALQFFLKKACASATEKLHARVVGEPWWGIVAEEDEEFESFYFLRIRGFAIPEKS